MATLTIEIPETVDIDKKRISMIVASKLYEQGRLSLGQASDVAGLTKRAFVELLADYGVSVFNFPVSDLSKEMRWIRFSGSCATAEPHPAAI